MRWWMAALVALVVTVGAGAPARAFGLSETLGATAVQGTLASTASIGVAPTIGTVQSQVGAAVSTQNQALSAALGASAPAVQGGGKATWVTAASLTPAPAGKGWATREGGVGGTSGWRTAEAFGGGKENAWPTAEDAWAHGGLLPN